MVLFQVYVTDSSPSYYLSGSYLGGPINLGDFSVNISWND